MTLPASALPVELPPAFLGVVRSATGKLWRDRLDARDFPALNGAVSAGDEVLLFGPGDSGEPTAQDWADLLGTISYEIVTRIGPRVPRVHA